MSMLISLICAGLSASASIQAPALESDVFTTDNGSRVEITFIKHGTLMIDVDGYTIHVDPVTMFGTDYSALPKADLLLVSHEHGDHYDKNAVAAVSKEGTTFLCNSSVAGLDPAGQALAVGDTRILADGKVKLTATAAYNCSPGHENFHPKGRDVGFLLDIDGFRIYIAGDTEDIPELAELKDIDVAFLPVNQPYTMTAEQCIKAIETFRPRIVYPYHYGETDLSPITSYFKDIDIRIRQLQ